MVKIKNVRRKATLEDALGNSALMEEMAKNMTKGTKVNLTVETDLIEIHSENYMVVDTDVLELVRQEISPIDYNRLFSLGVFLKTRYNILYNHTRPFTVETLSKQLDVNIDNTNKFIKRMTEKGIMAYTVCAPTGYLKKIYSINPQLIRRGIRYDKTFVTTFFTIYDKTFKDSADEVIEDTKQPSVMKPSKQF